MEISKEEILHIAKLARLKLKDEEIPNYIKNLQDILNFANIVNEAPVDGLETAVGAIDNFNVFRKDEIKVFEDNIDKENFLIQALKTNKVYKKELVPSPIVVDNN